MDRPQKKKWEGKIRENVMRVVVRMNDVEKKSALVGGSVCEDGKQPKLYGTQYCTSV
jgi:hypothetical protein